MRVYVLAKQLGMENRDLIPELKRMGITVASHSSVLDDDVVQKILEKLGPKLKASGRDANAGLGERSKAGLASDHAVGVKAGSSHAVPAAEESPKSDKRRILIKRKRADDAPIEEAASLPTVESAGKGGVLIDTLMVSSPSPAHPHVETPAVSQVDLTAPPDQPHSIGITTVPAPTAAVKLPAAPTVDVSGKKKAPSLEEMQAEGLKEKGKKARKPGRTREEEELRLR